MKKKRPASTSQVFTAEVHGVVAGRDVHIHQPPQTSWWELDLPDLLHERKTIKAQISAARRRTLMNVPTALSVVLLLCMIGLGIAALISLSNAPAGLGQFGAALPRNTLIGTVVCAVMLQALTIWRKHVLRPEWAVIRSARADLDDIEVVLRRRWGV